MKKKIISVMMLLLLIVVTIGTSYATLRFAKKGTVENTIETSTVMLTYNEGKTGIILENAYPISDEKGRVLIGDNNVFDFTVEAHTGSKVGINYEVSATKMPFSEEEALKDNEVKLYLERATTMDATYIAVMEPSYFMPIENTTTLGTPSGSMILDQGIFMNDGKTTHNYRLRMWVDETASWEMNGESKKYGIKVNVYAKQLTLEETDEACFTFDSANNTITGYSMSATCPKDVVIPSTIKGIDVTNIGDEAFSNKELTSVIFPSSVTSIGNYSFYGNQINSLLIPSSVTNIGAGAFVDNQLPDDKALIYNRKEDGSIDYTSLNSYGGKKKDAIVIPDNVTTIGEVAYYGCQLTHVTIPSHVTLIASAAFSKTNESNPNLEIVVNQTGKSFDWNAIIYGQNGNSTTTFVTGYINDVIVTDNIDILPSVSESCFTFNNGKITAYQDSCSKILVIPSTIDNTPVKVIGANAFSEKEITKVIIPNTVTTIEEYSFFENKITSVTIPDSVTYIGSGSFIGNSLPSEQAFIYNRNSDGSINYSSLNSYGGRIDELIIPSGITTIGQHAFYDVNLKTVTIPNTVRTIHEGAFLKNTASNQKLVKIINQTGRSFDWNSIVGGVSGTLFVTGSVSNSLGNVSITSE